MSENEKLIDQASESYVCLPGEHAWTSTKEANAPIWVIRCYICDRHDFEAMLAPYRLTVLREAMAAMIPDGAYNDHNRAEATGDRLGQAYHEGMHDAWASINDLVIKAETAT